MALGWEKVGSTSISCSIWSVWYLETSQLFLNSNIWNVWYVYHVVIEQIITNWFGSHDHGSIKITRLIIINECFFTFGISYFVIIPESCSVNDIPNARIQLITRCPYNSSSNSEKYEYFEWWNIGWNSIGLEKKQAVLECCCDMT